MKSIRSATKVEVTTRRAELTWQTQAICSFIASTIQDEKGQGEMMRRVEKITLLETPSGGVRPYHSDTSSDSRSLEEIMTQGNTHEALLRNSARKGPGLTQVFR